MKTSANTIKRFASSEKVLNFAVGVMPLGSTSGRTVVSLATSEANGLSYPRMSCSIAVWIVIFIFIINNLDLLL